jgi:hypothetical protein
VRATRTAVGAAGFPPAFRLNASPTARLYWRREDVLAYFAALAPQAPPAALAVASLEKSFAGTVNELLAVAGTIAP